MESSYINLLGNALSIWDISRENIKVWQSHYKFNNVHYLEFSYTNCLNDKVSQLIKKHEIQSVPVGDTSKNAFVVIGDDRADKWMRNLPKSATTNINLTLRSGNDPFTLVASLKTSGCSAIILADYDNTYVDIALCYALRYNGVRCIVEQTRDTDLNHALKNIGCYLVPWIRMSKHFKASLHSINSENNGNINNHQNITIPKTPNKIP